MSDFVLVVQESTALAVREDISTLVVDSAAPQLAVQGRGTTVTVQEAVSSLLLAASGPQGPPGAAGPAGGATFELDQVAAASTWLVQHNLGRYPAISVIDSAGNLVLTDVFYSDLNTVVLTFASPTTGRAVCA